jgi:hypothetical protein
MTVVSMSAKEFSRLDVLMDLEARRVTVRDACGLLRLKRRQVFRLLKDFRARGAASLISKRRGKPGNNRLPQPVRDLVMTLIKERYADFGPTLVAEKLLEVHDCRVSRETLRKWMIEDGLWLDRRRRLPSVHQPRNRRERRGELIQIDGSKHWWFENRGPQCTLLAYIDDATSQLMHAAFVPSEATFDYLRETHRYVPAAKGRIERSFGTLQDRLVKEMRLAGISTIEAANAFLPGFLADHNRRFAKEPISPSDAHRPVPQDMVLEDIFAWKEERTVTRNLTLQYDKVLFLLEPTELTRPLARQRVTVIDYPDGRLAIRHNGVDLPYRTYDKLRRVTQAAIVENKRLSEVLAYVAQRQQERDEQRSAKAPRRRGQGERHMFKTP